MMSNRNCKTCGSTQLSERGQRQAQRNDSTSMYIWSKRRWTTFNFDITLEECSHSFTRSQPNAHKPVLPLPSSSCQDHVIESFAHPESYKHPIQPESYKHPIQPSKQSEPLQPREHQSQRELHQRREEQLRREGQLRRGSPSETSQNKEQPARSIPRMEEEQKRIGEKGQKEKEGRSSEKREKGRHVLSFTTKPVTESRKQKIQEYIDRQVAYTRTMPNSTIQLLYQRPCLESYGGRTSALAGVCYGEHMKTHSVLPHSYTNYPTHYQTKTSALAFAKRTRKDPQQRWIKIERMLSKSLDFKKTVHHSADGCIPVTAKQEALKHNIKWIAKPSVPFQSSENQPHSKDKFIEGEKKLFERSKSTGKVKELNRYIIQENKQNPVNLIFKYHEKSVEGYDLTRYAKDRHGLTCYVDPKFAENQEAFLNHQKTKKPIFPQPCRAEDINIEQIRLENHEYFVEQHHARHYLAPNVEIPYEVSRYTRKKGFDSSKGTERTKV